MKGLKLRAYPNKAQKEQLNKTLGCARWIYNHFLSEKSTLYKEQGLNLPRFNMDKMLPELKVEYPWLSEVDSMALQESIKNLDKAYQNFFAKRAKYPRFHSKKGRQSYRTRNQNNGVRIANNKVKLPKVGWIKVKGLRELEGRILNATISKAPSGKYYISLNIDEPVVAKENAGGVIGIDVGIKSFYTDSNGNTVESPKTLNNHLKRLKRFQRKYSRSQKGSNNREKARIRLAIEHEKVSNIRKDFLHKVSKELADENQVIAIEHLNIKGMLKNHRLARHIADAGWGTLFAFLKYKTTERGGIVVEIPTFYSSSQTCSHCGYKNPLVKDLKIREWDCPECGVHHDRDKNAAENILKQGLLAI